MNGFFVSINNLWMLCASSETLYRSENQKFAVVTTEYVIKYMINYSNNKSLIID